MTSDTFCLMLGLLIGIIFISWACDYIPLATTVLILLVVFCVFGSPSMEQMAENDYYYTMEHKPKCMRDPNPSVSCKQDYIEWLEDSAEVATQFSDISNRLDATIKKGYAQ